jgi:predicted  nucleic acid-binding Zn-ribbon protein
MSFAPKKSMDRRSSPDSQKKSSTNLQESPFNVQQRSRSTLDPESTNRVDILEAHLSRISTQQDALLPLMTMLDLAPNVAKNENLLKNLSKKSNETDEKINRLEELIRGYQGNIDSAIQKINSLPKPQQFDAGLFERNLKLLNSQVIEHQNTLKDTQSNMDNFHKAFDARIDDEADHNLKIMETKLEKQKNEFSHAITELKLTINETLRKLDDALRELYEKVRSKISFIR